MATRDASRTGTFGRPGQSTAHRRLSRYDIVLVAIPLAFALGAVLGTALGLSLTAGLRVGSVLAGVMTAYALFGLAPTEGVPGSGSAR